MWGDGRRGKCKEAQRGATWCEHHNTEIWHAEPGLLFIVWVKERSSMSPKSEIKVLPCQQEQFDRSVGDRKRGASTSRDNVKKEH